MKHFRGGAGQVLASVIGAMGLSHGAALADQPVDRGLALQPPATEVHAQIVQFDNVLLVIISAITLLVLALLVWVMVRYNRAANPSPKAFTHNVAVEVVWTVVPVLILIFISTLSFPLLQREEQLFHGHKVVDASGEARPVRPEDVITIKALGNSWFWQHEYPDYGVTVTSNMLSRDDPALAQPGPDGKPRPALLAVDEPILVPVGAPVRLLVTSNDVIHSWAMPSFGVKEDAIPGRVNEGWFVVEREGVFYGQCSELCGIRHAFMPIEVRAVPRAQFDAWITQQGGSLAQGVAPAAQPLR